MATVSKPASIHVNRRQHGVSHLLLKGAPGDFANLLPQTGAGKARNSAGFTWEVVQAIPDAGFSRLRIKLVAEKKPHTAAMPMGAAADDLGGLTIDTVDITLTITVPDVEFVDDEL